MNKLIRVFIADDNRLLREGLASMIEVIDPIELLHISSQTEVDVVIVTPLKTNGDPKICSHLLLEYPTLKVVTLSAKGEVAYLYQSELPRLCINEPSGDTILVAIRDSLQVKKEKRHIDSNIF